MSTPTLGLSQWVKEKLSRDNSTKNMKNRHHANTQGARSSRSEEYTKPYDPHSLTL